MTQMGQVDSTIQSGCSDPTIQTGLADRETQMGWSSPTIQTNLTSPMTHTGQSLVPIVSSGPLGKVIGSIELVWVVRLA